MKKTYCYLFVISTLLIGCQPSENETLEKKYLEAKQQGLLDKQLIIIDELATMAPRKYSDLVEAKKLLLPTIKLLNVKDDNYWQISENQITELVRFSPSFPLIKKLQSDHKEKSKLQLEIDKLKNEISTAESIIQQKLQATPKQIETFDTEIKLSALPSKILHDKSWQKLFSASESLNNYQLEALLMGLTEIASKSHKLDGKLKQLSQLFLQKEQHLANIQSPLISDIALIVLELFRQQINHCYLWGVEQNDSLLYLLDTGLGHKRLDTFWQESFEPRARKAVFQAKANQLEVLNIIANYGESLPEQTETMNHLYDESPQIKRLLLNLLWPNEGLYEFTEQSAESKVLLQTYLTR